MIHEGGKIATELVAVIPSSSAQQLIDIAGSMWYFWYCTVADSWDHKTAKSKEELCWHSYGCATFATSLDPSYSARTTVRRGSHVLLTKSVNFTWRAELLEVGRTMATPTIHSTSRFKSRGTKGCILNYRIGKYTSAISCKNENTRSLCKTKSSLCAFCFFRSDEKPAGTTTTTFH